MRRETNRGRFNRAAQAFALWNKSKGKVLPGLVRRRKAEAKLFLLPDSTGALADGVAAQPAADNQSKMTAAQPAAEEEGSVKNEPAANDFAPQPDKAVKTIDAPPPDGTTSTATKLTIAGLTVPPALAAVIRTVQEAIAGGFVDAKTIGDGVTGFLTDNYKYVFVGIGILIAFLTIKKLFKQITLWLEMYFAASREYNDVRVNKG